MHIYQHPTELPFPSACGIHPTTLALKAAVIRACDIQNSALLDSLIDCEIARNTDANHERLFSFIPLPVLSIDIITSRFREALALRPRGQPDHTLSLYHYIFALNWRYNEEPAAGTYLRSIDVDGANDYVINNLPIDASDECVHLRRNVHELCPLDHQRLPIALNKLLHSFFTRFRPVSLSEGHPDYGNYLNDLTVSLRSHFDHQGKSHDLDEVVSMHEEALRLYPVGHKIRDSSLHNLVGALRTRLNKCGDIDDINRANSLHRKAPTLNPPGQSTS
ncbi:hypothetical protein DEU56DRAFT_915312 [Suillus clintonianus]|uniref:uncharacterized protein n=1 Tax=Suillus clintonianus TaxID=1904413 RepID=UPI001B85E33D|nr:uncharacterized protein DEU56DRAFT_915312 [Suillus clintonianus]KAG2128993.1 hypothetical protein DEU56DRAFT_915312 [Suillus clintonianus]